MTHYPHWHTRTIHGWPWYKRLGYYLKAFVVALMGRTGRD